MMLSPAPFPRMPLPLQQRVWLAVRDDKPEHLKALLQSLGPHHDVKDLYWTDAKGRTPLIYAAKKNYCQCAYLLLQAKVDDVNYMNRLPGSRGTALHEAVHEKNDKMVTILLNHGASPFLANSSGNTPWVVAAQTSYTHAFKHMKRLANYESVVYMKAPECGGLLKKWKPRHLMLMSHISFRTGQNVPQLWIASQDSLIPRTRINLQQTSVIQTDDTSATLRLQETEPHPGPEVAAVFDRGFCIFLKEFDSTTCSHDKFLELLGVLSEASGRSCGTNSSVQHPQQWPPHVPPPQLFSVPPPHPMPQPPPHPPATVPAPQPVPQPTPVPSPQLFPVPPHPLPQPVPQPPPAPPPQLIPVPPTCLMPHPTPALPTLVLSPLLFPVPPSQPMPQLAPAQPLPAPSQQLFPVPPSQPMPQLAPAQPAPSPPPPQLFPVPPQNPMPRLTPAQPAPAPTCMPGPQPLIQPEPQPPPMCPPVSSTMPASQLEAPQPPSPGHGDPIMAQSAQELLHAVCTTGEAEIAELLLQQGADAQKENEEGTTPLSAACKAGHLPVVKVLLTAGAQVNKANYRGLTPLALARQGGHHHVVETLLSAGADPNTPSTVRAQPMSEAGRRGHQQIMGLFCQQLAGDVGVDGNLAAGEGEAHAQSCEPPMLRPTQLTTLEEDSNTQPRLQEQVPQGDAGRQQNVQVLLQAASTRGDAEAAQLLLEQGADAHKADEEGTTPLIAASRDGHLQLVELLLQQDAEVDVSDQWGATPLLRACERGCLPVARSLLQKGARIDKANYCGMSPLFFVCSRGNRPLVEEMLENSEGSLDSASYAGVSPAEEARKKGHLDIVELLDQYQAKQPAADAGADDSHERHQEGLKSKQDEVQRQMQLCDQLQHAVLETTRAQEEDDNEEVQAQLQRQLQEASRANEQLKSLQQQLRDMSASHCSVGHSEADSCETQDSRVRPPPKPGVWSLSSRAVRAPHRDSASPTSPMAGILNLSERNTLLDGHAGSSSNSLHSPGTPRDPCELSLPAQGRTGSSSSSLHSPGTPRDSSKRNTLVEGCTGSSSNHLHGPGTSGAATVHSASVPPALPPSAPPQHASMPAWHPDVPRWLLASEAGPPPWALPGSHDYAATKAALEAAVAAREYAAAKHEAWRRFIQKEQASAKALYWGLRNSGSVRGDVQEALLQQSSPASRTTSSVPSISEATRNLSTLDSESAASDHFNDLDSFHERILPDRELRQSRAAIRMQMWDCRDQRLDRGQRSEFLIAEFLGFMS